MVRPRSSRAASSEGFTLVEIIIAIIILAILVGVATVGFRGATGYSQRRACETDVRNLLGAMGALANDWSPVGTLKFNVVEIDPKSKEPVMTRPLYAFPPEGSAKYQLIPTYLQPLSKVATSSTTGTAYSLTATLTGSDTSAATFDVTIDRAPTSSGQITVTTGTVPDGSTTTFSSTDVASACKAALP